MTVPGHGGVLCSLLKRLRSNQGDEAELHLQAWSMVENPMPVDMATLLMRGAYLESVLGFSSRWLDRRLTSWRIAYTSVGGPYSAMVRLSVDGGPEDRYESGSDGSATRALMAAVIMART